MKFGKYILSAMFTVALAVLFCSPALGHSAFKKELQKKYPDMKISCNACHVDKKPKTERNHFGQLFQREFKDLDISKNFKEKKGDDKKEYTEKVMVPEFTKALDKVTKMTVGEILQAGVVAGVDLEGEEGAEGDAESDE